MESGAYSIGTDGSNDEGSLKKLNPIVIRPFDNSKARVSSQLLEMGASKESTAEALFNNLDNVLEINDISWQNCVALSVDNTAVNIGKRNSIKTRVLKMNPNTFVNGCPCHLIHNTLARLQKCSQEYRNLMWRIFWLIYSIGLTKARNERLVFTRQLKII